ncbi:MAG: D-alanyl-D-alanine carboxypeptidase family protein [Nitrospinota bacterium]
MRLKRPLFARILLSLFLLAFAQASWALPASAQKKTDPKRPRYESAILMDAETGQVLYEYQPDEERIPASLVKMMLMLLVMESIQKGAFALDQKVTVSREASRIGGSQVYLREGEVFTLEELLKAVVIASANDAAYAVAEHIAGTPEAMVDLMNERARELGMTNTKYTNVHGLPPDPGEEQDHTSARDIATLARQIIQHPLLLKWGRTIRDTFRGGKFTLYNTNKLLSSFPGMDGIKTGYYAKAGFNLCATAKRGDVRLISVILGAPTEKDRFRETRRLLTQGFRVYKKVTFFADGGPVGKPIPVKRGKKKETTAVAAGPVSVLVKRIQAPNVKTRIAWTETPLKAPVRKGQEVGRAELVLGGKVIASVPLKATEDIPRKRWYDWLMFWK